MPTLMGKGFWLPIHISLLTHLFKKSKFWSGGFQGIVLVSARGKRPRSRTQRRGAAPIIITMSDVRHQMLVVSTATHNVSGGRMSAEKRAEEFSNICLLAFLTHRD